MRIENGLITIKGDHTDKIDEILKSFGFSSIRSLKADRLIEVNMLTSEATSGDFFGIAVHKGWTIIIDNYQVLLNTDGRYNKWQKWSSLLNTEIFAMRTEHVAECNSFCVFKNGDLIRKFLIADTDIQEDIGRLAVEARYEDNVYRSLQILEILEAVTSISPDDFFSIDNFIVKLCDPDDLPVIGFVYDGSSNEGVDDPNCKLIIRGIELNPWHTERYGFFWFDTPSGVEPSTDITQNRLVVEKDGKTGQVILTKENWLNLHRITIN